LISQERIRGSHQYSGDAAHTARGLSHAGWFNRTLVQTVQRDARRHRAEVAAGLDIPASRTGNRLYLDIANLKYARAVGATFPGTAGGRVLEIAPEDLQSYVNQDPADVFHPRETTVKDSSWRFPAGSGLCSRTRAGIARGSLAKPSSQQWTPGSDRI
jgi:hypothetical protein